METNQALPLPALDLRDDQEMLRVKHVFAIRIEAYQNLDRQWSGCLAKSHGTRLGDVAPAEVDLRGQDRYSVDLDLRVDMPWSAAVDLGQDRPE
jgi:hypothetical protein